LRSTTSFSSRTHCTKRNAPVPMGLAASACTPCSFRALGGIGRKSLPAMRSMRPGHGFSVMKRTV
jgi:hypothetical protein